MSDSQQKPSDRPGDNTPEFSVSEISGILKRMVEQNFSHVRVRGEISGFKRAGSGHLYMALKDDQAVIDGVCWRSTAQRLSVEPEDGLEVIVTGKLTTYPGRSKYQIVIESMEHAGEGALLKLLEERKKRLEAEGLFDPAHKKPIPFLPDVIGVVTSPTGAVIRDILHRLRDRFPSHVLLWPVLVQGDGAAEQVAAAIRGFNRIEPGGAVPRPDLLIVARGGGSLEDLWAFNEEVVARAAAESDIPLISAVGHETDVTLIDFVSDRRAPTPTAAAEMAVPVRRDLIADLLDRERRMIGSWTRYTDRAAMQLDGLGRGLPDPRSLLDTATQRLDDASERQTNAMRNLLRHENQALSGIAARLRSPRQVLDAQGERLAQLADRLAGASKRRVAAEHDRFGRTEFGARLGKALTRRLRENATALDQLGRRLESVSYKNILDRGFAVVRDAAGAPLSKGAGLAPGTAISIEFSDSGEDARVPATVGDGTQTGRKQTAAKPKPAPRKPTGAEPKQGTLL